MSKSQSSNTVTEGIRVQAAAQYRPDQSDADVPVYLFSYRIMITNEGDRSVRLLSRHWVIRDSENDRKDVEGRGVVGEFPHLAPGESFEYESSCPLPTSWGTMEGSYTFTIIDPLKAVVMAEGGGFKKGGEEVVFIGSSFGGSMLKMHWAGPDSRVEAGGLILPWTTGLMLNDKTVLSSKGVQ